MSISDYALPVVLGVILLTALVRCRGAFSIFTKGAAEGFETVLKIAPSLIGLITAVDMFKASGALDMLVFTAAPVAHALHIPEQILPLVLLRPISGSGSLALLDRLLSQQGAAAFCSRVACVLCASSETTFYTTTLYFSTVGIKKVRHTIVCAVIADIAGIFISTAVVSVMG